MPTPSTDPASPLPGLPPLDAALAQPTLQPNARAFLLLRICQMAHLLHSPRLPHYWDLLQQANASLRPQDRANFVGLKAALEPKHPGRLSAFARELVDLAAAAAALASQDQAAATQQLESCEHRLRQRWWPFGKAPAWLAIVSAWETIDRAAALTRIGKVRREARKSLLLQWNNRRPLTPEDWTQAKSHDGFQGAVNDAILEVLDADDPVLRLSADTGKATGQLLLPQIHKTPAEGEDERTVDRARDTARVRYLKLVRSLAPHSPEAAEFLLESLFLETANTSRFATTWPERFSAIRRLIEFWAALPQVHDAGAAFIPAKAPAFLRDFALVEWHGQSLASSDQAAAAWPDLKSKCADPVSAEIWFVITLVRRGWAQAALAVAQTSAQSSDLLPRIRRAWLCLDPETAAKAISANDFAGDIPGRFLLAGSVAERVAFLRQATRNGQEPIPDALWSRPDITVMLPDTLDQSHANERRGLLHLYSKNEKPENQFKQYLHLHAFAHFGYESVDPYLLSTLVAWDDQHPEELRPLLERMWNTMKPDEFILTIDLLRNTIFERCRAVLPAHPDAFTTLFVDWVKRTLVDTQVRHQVGDTIYTLSLKSIVPFLFCLLAAQNLARTSASRCDSLLEQALAKYETDDDLTISAAELYASDKGLDALVPPVALKPNHRLASWQCGVIQAASRQILNLLVAAQPTA